MDDKKESPFLGRLLSTFTEKKDMVVSSIKLLDKRIAKEAITEAAKVTDIARLDTQIPEMVKTVGLYGALYFVMNRASILAHELGHLTLGFIPGKGGISIVIPTPFIPWGLTAFCDDSFYLNRRFSALATLAAGPIAGSLSAIHCLHYSRVYQEYRNNGHNFEQAWVKAKENTQNYKNDPLVAACVASLVLTNIANFIPFMIDGKKITTLVTEEDLRKSGIMISDGARIAAHLKHKPQHILPAAALAGACALGAGYASYKNLNYLI